MKNFRNSLRISAQPAYKKRNTTTDTPKKNGNQQNLFRRSSFFNQMYAKKPLENFQVYSNDNEANIPNSFEEENGKTHEIKKIENGENEENDANGKFKNEIKLHVQTEEMAEKEKNSLFQKTPVFRRIRSLAKRQLEIIKDAVFFIEDSNQEPKLKRSLTKTTTFVKKRVFLNLANFKSAFLYWKTHGLFEKALSKLMTKVDDSIPVIKPYQKFKVIWDILILLTIVMYFYLLPLQLSFDFAFDEEMETFLANHLSLSHTSAKFLSLIPEFILIIDTILKFFTGYYENGLVITQKSKIRKHYIKKGLLFDIFAYSPIIAQNFMKSSEIAATILKIFQLLMFFKIPRVKTILRNFQEMISLEGKNDYFLSILNLAWEMLFFTHIMACIWHAWAYYNNSTENLTWLDYLNLRGYDWFTRYAFSLHWVVSIVLSIGYLESLVAQNSSEQLIGVFICVMGFLLYVYIFHQMRDYFTLMNRKNRNYKQSLMIINSFMKRKNIDFELQGKVRKYLKFTMQKESDAEKEIQILNKMTKTLKRELILESSGKMLSQIPFFEKNFSKEFIEELSFSLKEIKFSPEEYVYQMDILDSCSLYFLDRGVLETSIYKNQDFSTIAEIKKGDLFGLRSFFADEPRENSVRCKTFASVFELKKSDFLKILKNHSNDYTKYCFFRDQIKLYSNYSLMPFRCLCCHENTHSLADCPKIHYVARKDNLARINNISQKQERNSDFFRSLKHKKVNARYVREKLFDNALRVNLGTYGDLDSFSEFDERFLQANLVFSGKSFEEKEKEKEEEIIPFPVEMGNSSKYYNSTKSLAADHKEPDSPFSLASPFLPKTINKIENKQKNLLLIPRSNKNPIIEELFIYDFETIKSYSGYFENGNFENLILREGNEDFQGRSFVFKKLKSRKSQKKI